MELVDSCNLCEGTRFALFTEMVGHKTRKRFRIVRCEGCGLLFVSPRLTPEENEALYDEAYFNGAGFDPSVNYMRLDQQADMRQGENAGILQKIRALKPARDIRILDVGCGTGGLLRALGDAGYEHISGIELSSYAADIARKHTHAEVFTGDILALPLPKASVDVINATEVIEHLRDPLAFFQRVRALLKPEGVFIYSTGNARGIYARLLGRHWPYLHPEGHLFYYTPQTLTSYFERVNLRPLDVRKLDPSIRHAIMTADDRIAHSQLHYIGHGERGIKGHLSRALASLDTPAVMRAWSLLLGKYRLPIGVSPGAN
jgi:2-polyprenyl-3-methyl-5-hydroxy-6-metoxy-1,4-benzoquinol methylase